MADLEIDDVQFLTEDGRVSASGRDKRAVYEPSRSQRVRQVVCSQRKTVCVVSMVAAVILCIAAIAAFARPGSYLCENLLEKNETSSHHPSQTEGLKHTTTETFPWNNVRLPSYIFPVQYDIFMHPNLTTFYFEGSVHIHFTVQKLTEFIVLHGKHLNITRQELLNAEFNQKYSIKKTQYNKKLEQYYIIFSPALRPSKEYYIKLGFQGMLSDKLDGFYRSTYKTKEGVTRYLATTHFEPTHARSAFPCFDEPAMKAKFKISIVRDPEKHISLFNTRKNSTKPFEHFLVVDEFEESVEMSTYIVAFVISDFHSISMKSVKNKILVSVYAPEDRINLAQFALNISVHLLDFFENYFEIDYPLHKLDLIAIPDFGAGAMENWGLITFRENSLLVDPFEASPSSLQWVVVVCAHELAHQWFGNYVTMKWWSDLWLNEGFASFLENLAATSLIPDWKMMEQFTVDGTQTALALDSLVNSHPISEEVNDPSDIESIFDDISYRKGAAVLFMLSNFLGYNNLRMSLNAFLKKYKYSNAETEDLWNAMSEVSSKTTDINVKTVMDSWTRQKGYPLITITQTGTTIHANQKPFTLSPTTDDISVETYKAQLSSTWHVPLTYTYLLEDSDTPSNNSVWMPKTDRNFTVPGNIVWFKANNNQGGFYRVTYDNNIWTNLIRALVSKHQVFTPADRSNLLDDSFTLSLARKLNITRFLEMTRYLSFERDYLPWTSALNGLNKMRILLRESASQVFLKTYILTLIKPAIEELGWNSIGSHLERKLRIELLYEGCKYGEEDTLNQAKERFEAWKTGKQIDKDFRKMVYSVGVQYGDASDWEFVWQKYNSSMVPVEKRNLMAALSKTRDTWRISQLLEYSLQEDKIRSQDTPILLGDLAQNPAGNLLTWRFIQRNWNKLVEKFGSGSFSMDNIISQSTQDFSTDFDYNQVKSFFESVHVGSGMRSVKQSLEKILINTEWLKTYEKDVLNWLQTAVFDIPEK